MFSVQITGIERVRDKLTRMIKYSPDEVEKITKVYSRRLVAQIKTNASGPPGPNVITGRYRASWQWFEHGRWTAGAQTDAPQAARLEFGFVGVDSAGRHYQQGPRPHITPAKDIVRSEYTQAMGKAVRRIWR
jgi:hypothetical protein